MDRWNMSMMYHRLELIYPQLLNHHHHLFWIIVDIVLHLLQNEIKRKRIGHRGRAKVKRHYLKKNLWTSIIKFIYPSDD